MPEINSKRNTKKQTRTPKKKKPTTKKKSAPFGQNLKWKSTSTTKSESTIPRRQLYLGLLGLFLFFMFILWAFVDDRPEWQRYQQQQEQERRANETLAKQQERQQRTAALQQFNHAELMNSSSLSQSLQLMQTGEDDRLVVVAFADSTAGDSPGSVYRIRLFKKLEGIAKRIDKNKLFKRYEADDLPRFLLFDCGSPTDAASENVCAQIVGQSVPNILVFRPSSQPRSLPSDLKSDKDILSYLYRLMQPAVEYLEEVVDAENFVSDDSAMHCVLFHGGGEAQKSAVSTYDAVADALRDYGRFGRTRDASAMEAFDVDEAQLPALMVWRTFGSNPVLFSGNSSDTEAVRDFLLKQFVPLFGEFTPSISSRFMQRGLPILWFAVGDAMREGERDALLAKGEELALRYQGQLTFVYLDVDAQPQIAQNFGLEGKKSDEDGDEEDEDEDMEDVSDGEGDGLPQVFIMNQVAQIKRGVDMEDVEGTVQGVIDEYLLQLRISRGQAMGELHGEDDPEFEDDDDFEDDEDEEEDYEDTEINLDGQKGDEDEQEEDGEEGEGEEKKDL